MRRDVFTPYAVALEAVSKLPIERGSRVLDLGCGEGVFLEAAAEVLQARGASTTAEIASALTGIEQDPRRVAASKGRLALRFGGRPSDWNVRCSDALSLAETERYDIVVGNPPWVRAHHLEAADRDDYRKRFRSATGNFDLSFLFVEKALRLLGPKGVLSLIVSGGFGVQPAATQLRELLADHGHWSLDPVPQDGFRPSASIKPALLRCNPSQPTEAASGSGGATSNPPAEISLGQIATVRAGVATGANDVFLISEAEAKNHEIEESRLRHVVRGRTLQGRTEDHVLIWPYEPDGERWALVDLSAFPATEAYLGQHRDHLANRPRLMDSIQKKPDTWYRFISLPRPATSQRFAIADVFREPAWTAISDPAVVVLNTAFEVTPHAGCEEMVHGTLQSTAFWALLTARSRNLQGAYRRTSASELRASPCPADNQGPSIGRNLTGGQTSGG